MSAPLVHEGGCLCGAVRYAFREPVRDTGYCHCRMCQVSLGAPVSAWVTVDGDSFTWTRGEAQIYRSSAQCERHFCGTCGAQVLFVDFSADGLVDVNVGTVDDPERFPPAHHIWTDSRVEWLTIDDDLPRHPGAGPDGPHAKPVD